MEVSAMNMGPEFLSFSPEWYFDGSWNTLPFLADSDYSLELYIKVWSCHYDHSQLEKLREIARKLNRHGRNDKPIQHIEKWIKLAKTPKAKISKDLTFEGFYGRIRDYISGDNKQQARNLYNTGQTGREKIKWMDNARTLVEIMHQAFQNEIFLVPDDITFSLFIANNFVQGKGKNKGQPFTEKTIQNEISDLENPQK